MNFAWLFLMAAPWLGQTVAPVTQGRISPPRSAQAAPLAALVREAEAANPAILAARRAWRAAERRPSQVSALPDPELEFSTMNVGGPLPLTGLPDQMMGYAGVGVSETFPFFGKLRLRGEMAQRNAQIAKQQVRAVERQVRAGVRAAYYRIGGLSEVLAVLAEDGRALQAVNEIATSRYRQGEVSEADVLKAQAERTELLAEQTVARQKMAVAEAQLKTLLNRPLDAPDLATAPLAELPMPSHPAALAAGVRSNPELRARRLAEAREQLGVELAHRNFYPDLHASYMYQATGPGFPYRSALTVGISLPLFWRRKQAPAAAEAGERAAEAQDRTDAERERLSERARAWYLQAEAEQRLLEIDRGGLLPQTAAAWRAELAAYEAGQEDFQSLMGAFLAYENLRENYWRTLANHDIAVARMEEIAGAVAGQPESRAPAVGIEER